MEQVNPAGHSGLWLWPRNALNLAEARLACAATSRCAACCIADRVDPVSGAPDFNRAVTLRDSWGKAGTA
jgi:hypothetical protein